MNKDIEKGAEQIANRLDNGIDNFYENCRAIVPDLTAGECGHIFAVYKSLKVIKRDFVSGRWNVVHGAYWSETAILNAKNHQI